MTTPELLDTMVRMKKSPLIEVRIADIVPRGAALPARLPAAYVGVSTGNPNFKGRRLLALLDWICGKSDRCTLVIGQRLQRWTIQMTTESLESVRALADENARRQLSELRAALAECVRPVAFSVVLDSQLQQHPRFASSLRELKKAYADGGRFAALIDLSARDYCALRAARGQKICVPADRALELSRHFIVEELALYCVLVSTGACYEIYPGPELPVLIAIANGEIANVPTELGTRVNLSVAVETIALEQAA